VLGTVNGFTQKEGVAHGKRKGGKKGNILAKKRKKSNTFATPILELNLPRREGREEGGRSRREKEEPQLPLVEEGEKTFLILSGKSHRYNPTRKAN